MFAGAPITYSPEQRRYVASVDGKAHQSAVEIIGELEARLEAMEARARIAESNYSRMSQPTVKMHVGRHGDFDFVELKVVDIGYSEGVIVVEGPKPDEVASRCAAYARALEDIRRRLRIHVDGHRLSKGSALFLPTFEQCSLLIEVVDEAMNTGVGNGQ